MFDGVYVMEPMVPRRDALLKEAPAVTIEEDFEEHPVWVRPRATLMMALQPFAEARAAVVLALEKTFAPAPA